MLHEPAAGSGKDPAFAYKRRLGVVLFLVYGTVYAGFVVLNLVAPLLMDSILLLGLNVAIMYGFGLIVFALLLALAYNRACGKKEAALAEPRKGEA
jgi:uncharacterized membrane protein (DUF485 family)